MNSLPQPPAPAPQLPPPDVQQVRTWNMWCHLSSLSGLVVPFGNILGPLLIWQIKKDEIPSVELHGKAALNFQLTVFIGVIVAAVIAIPLFFFFCLGLIMIPVIGGIHVLGIVFSVIAGIKANAGEEFRYPWSLRLLA